jgi:hypothetical protein
MAGVIARAVAAVRTLDLRGGRRGGDLQWCTRPWCKFVQRGTPKCSVVLRFMYYIFFAMRLWRDISGVTAFWGLLEPRLCRGSSADLDTPWPRQTFAEVHSRSAWYQKLLRRSSQDLAMQ